jgi:mannose-1-phosphate guanylyltransferase
MRLRSLTWRLMGDERPKQFCPVIGHRTLLEETWRRTALAVPADRILVVVTRKHERFYAPTLEVLAAQRRAVVQPENRGTAAGILYPLLRLASVAPEASVAVFPSDHYFSDEPRFMAHVEMAFVDALDVYPQRVVLLGIPPDTHEAEYGWIEGGDALRAGAPVLCQVRHFWEKPDPALAEKLRKRGCLWNSFVMVARVEALLALVWSAAPDFYDAFDRIRPALGTTSEAEAVRALYARLPSLDFSKEILSMCPGLLGLLRVRGVVWTDLGSPERVQRVRSALLLLRGLCAVRGTP